MNVASLQHYPSIKWYFVVAVPLVRFRQDSYLNKTVSNQRSDVDSARLLVRIPANIAFCGELEINWIFG